MRLKKLNIFKLWQMLFIFKLSNTVMNDAYAKKEILIFFRTNAQRN